MDHVLTIVLANEKHNFLRYFAEIGNETVLSRNLRLLESNNPVVICDHREWVCPDDCVTVIPASAHGALKEAWVNIRDYEFKFCKVLCGQIVLSQRMAYSIQQDRRHIGLYGNLKNVFGFVLHKERKHDFLSWSLNEWRKSPNADLSTMIQFHTGKLLLSHDYSDTYSPEIEQEALNDDKKHKRINVV
jgi:hypothetical protein